tara:strand:+ start:660 stop:1706 length:1047 start_codon:yes stop_codon:yes gene_type:complete
MINGVKRSESALLHAGSPLFGQFKDSLRHVQGQLDTSLDAFGHSRSAFARRLGYKQFQFFGGMSEELVFGCALVSLGHSCSAFIYAVDMRTGERFEHSSMRPGSMGMSLSDNPREGSSHCQMGRLQVEQRYFDQPRQKQLKVSIGEEFVLEALSHETDFEPMSLCTRSGYNGWTYANKTAGVALTGSLLWRGKKIDLETIKCMGHHDFSCGFMRPETWWNWACFSGHAELEGGAESAAIGLNISCGVNETSYSENCFWLNGECINTAAAVFDFDRQVPLSEWKIHTHDDSVSLRFTPLGIYEDNTRLGPLAARFRQVFGHFDGYLIHQGQRYLIKRLSGFVEDQFVRW